MNRQSVEVLYKKHKSLINKVIRKNRCLLAALDLEEEDVAQHLAITMLSAIKRFDSAKSKSLQAYIRYSLQFEIQKMKRWHRPHGITDVPKGVRLKFLYLDDTPNATRVNRQLYGS